MDANNYNLSQRPPLGTLTRFVREQINLTNRPQAEGRRLFDLAQTRGIRTTLGSVTQAVYIERQQHGIKPMAANQHTRGRQGRKGVEREGPTKAFIYAHGVDLTAPLNREGRRLEAVAKTLGLPFTYSAITSAIGRERGRKRRRGKGQGRPSAGPIVVPERSRVASEAVLTMIDQSMEGLRLLRQHVTQLSKDAAELAKLKEKLRGLGL